MTTTPSQPYNPWREFVENCISGDNYFRASEYREIIDDIDGLTVERDTLKAELAALQTDHIALRTDYTTVEAELAALQSQEPSAYQYLFAGPYGDVWRNDSREWNGVAPKDARPLFAAPVPAAPTVTEPTNEQIIRAAREISARQALICGIDPDDMWKQYGDDFKDEAKAILKAAKGTP